MSDCRGVLTAVEVAELFGVSEREVYGLCASGVLPHYICFDAAEIEGYLKRCVNDTKGCGEDAFAAEKQVWCGEA